jgi:murein L,D-transpeptidase YcbB/YkuD
MRGGLPVAVLVGVAWASALMAPVWAEEGPSAKPDAVPPLPTKPERPAAKPAGSGNAESTPAAVLPTTVAAPTSTGTSPIATTGASQPAPAVNPIGAAVEQPTSTAAETAPPVPADPVVVLIRSKLADAELRKGPHADDLAALETFYASRTSGPVWTSDMGFSTQAQSILFEIADAEDWGLDPKQISLPPHGELPANDEAQAAAEIRLQLAVLTYARHARGGRLVPVQLSSRFDLTPPLRDPKTVLAEIETAEAPDAYLRSLHPKHEQFVRLRQALLAARGKGADSKPAKAVDAGRDEAKTVGGEQTTDNKKEQSGGDDPAAKAATKPEPASEATAKPLASDKDIKRLVLNLERWRWMPEDLGKIHVVNNSPEFMLYVVKDGKRIYADKTLVGTINYATPIFSADMKTIVFNPDWYAPPTVVVENLLPHLARGNAGILKTHKLSVSRNGAAVDPRGVKWSRSNVLAYTFTQKSGPTNVLGKVKFLYPNKHTVYMHDTLAYRKKVFKDQKRAIGHECVRMEKPLRFAEVLLKEGNGWSAGKVKELWDRGVNSSVVLESRIPVHTTYFTAAVDEKGKVQTFADLYGFDHKLAAALFGSAAGFPMPPPEAKKAPSAVASTSSVTRTSAGGGTGIASSLGGFLDE